MKTIILAVLTILSTIVLPASAAEYVLGRDYQPCEEKFTKIVFPVGEYRDCTIPNTQLFYSDVYTAEDGTQRVRELEGKLMIECSDSRVCSSLGSMTYQRGFFAGKGFKGKYMITYRFYLDEDYNGNAVAYAIGRGPQFNEDPVGDPWANEAGGAPIAAGGE